MKKLTVLLLTFCLLLTGCSSHTGTEAARTAAPESESIAPATEPAAEPSSFSAVESVNEPATAPVTEPSDVPVTEPATTPAAGFTSESAPSTGQIWLYGEVHATPACLEKELEIWAGFYAGGMRDLFIEYPFYTAEFLNEWMHADSDDILDRLYQDWAGTQGHSENVLEFFRRIKQDHPETVFHGTDVGHQYETTGQRYLKRLEEAGQKDSSAYDLAEEIIRQGRKFYNTGRMDYREDRMAENFIREFDRLGGKDVMGIFGFAHTDPEKPDSSGRTDSMASQLAARYGDALHTTDLTFRESLRTDRIPVAGKEYEATYFGRKEYGPDSPVDFLALDFWRLENAYEDFASCPDVLNVLPYSNFPMKVEEGQIFIVDVTWRDGTVDRFYYRSNGAVYNGLPAAQEFSIEEDGKTE